MRTRITILTGALLVATAIYTQAQDTTPVAAQTQPSASTFTPKLEPSPMAEIIWFLR